MASWKMKEEGQPGTDNRPLHSRNRGKEGKATREERTSRGGICLVGQRGKNMAFEVLRLRGGGTIF